MEDMAIVIMEKDNNTGFLDKELGSYSIEYSIDYINRIFVKKEDEYKVVYLYLMVPGNFEEWEFNAILDNYDFSLYEQRNIMIKEDEDNYNPAWQIEFKFIENDSEMEKRLNEILEIHDGQIKKILEDIKNMENDYKG